MPQIEAHFPGQAKWGLYPLNVVFIMYLTNLLNTKEKSMSQMTTQFMGYTIHRAVVFYPHTILFTKENETVTVSMLQEALSHIVDVIVKKSPVLARYEIALKVLRAVQIRLTNGQPRKPSKNDLKVACDVLSEIQKEYAMTEEQRDRIDTAAFWCKLFIEGFMRN